MLDDVDLLLVEDDPDVMDTLKRGIEQFSAARVIAAMDRRSGEALLRTRHPHVAIIDLVLHDKSGFGLVELATELNIPALAMTGEKSSLELCRAYNVPHLVKPFTGSYLVSAVRDLIGANGDSVQQARIAIARLKSETRRSLPNLVALARETTKRTEVELARLKATHATLPRAS